MLAEGEDSGDAVQVRTYDFAEDAENAEDRENEIVSSIMYCCVALLPSLFPIFSSHLATAPKQHSER